MRFLDLFSGIGGFSLGLERAGHETVAFCEIEPYCRAVLAKHWPNVPIYEDIRLLTAECLAADGITIDAICGGFPCQDVSLLGTGEGLDGVRSGLWSEYARLIGELRPRYVIVENVAALLHRGLGRVLRDLASFGYGVEWHCLQASRLGALQDRDRVWVIAYRHERTAGAWWFKWLLHSTEIDWPRLVFPRRSRRPNGIPDWVDRVGACGNAVMPQIPELIGLALKD